jgi:hypothetical protein
MGGLDAPPPVTLVWARVLDMSGAVRGVRTGPWFSSTT